MKKIISLLLCAVMLFSVMSLVGCGKKEESPESTKSPATSGPAKLGLGVVSYIEKVESAKDDANGTGNTSSTFAAVLLDKDGKIIDCAIDAVGLTHSFTSEGKFIEVKDIKTKYEAGKDYGMVAYGGATKEWYEQVDAFVKLVKGKSLDEVKALLANDGKGNDDVIKAGCTIIITDFVKALEKAVGNAKDLGATATDKVKLGVVATQTGCKDATEEAAGLNEIDITVSAAAVNADAKVTAMVTDALQAKISFNNKGEVAVSATDIATKLEIGKDYGMVAYGGAKKEWYEQVAEFDKACKGKNADEIAKLVTESGKGSSDIQSAGCTIDITDIVKAAVKAAK